MNDDPEIQKIKDVYSNFKTKLNDISSRKKALLKNYRLKIEEVKMKEIKESLNSK